MNTIRLDIQPTRYGQRIALPDRDLGKGTVFMLAWISGPAAIEMN